MFPIISRRRLLQAGVCSAATLAVPAWAQLAAGRPITLVVPYSPGGTGDILGRALAHALSEVTGNTCVVENRGGAGGNVGAERVVHARPDGLTLLFTATSLASNPSLMKTMNFDPQKDLTAVAGPITLQNIVMVNNDLPVHDIQGLVDHAKAHPGTLTFGSSGIGSSNHLAAELFKAEAGVEMLHIPYKSAGEVIPSLISGTTQVMFDLMPSSLPHVQANKVRALAVTGSTRSPLFPDLPTVAEAGVPDYQFSAWFGVFAPSATPVAIVEELNVAINKAMTTPALSERLAQLGAEAQINSPEAFASYFKGETDRWAQVIRNSGITLEN